MSEMVVNELQNQASASKIDKGGGDVSSANAVQQSKMRKAAYIHVQN